MKFSIITVCFNSEKTIKDTIESVLNQTYSNIEYIIIDGNSNDTTVEIIKYYEVKFNQKNISYKWISEPDKGIYDAMNKGLSMANGDLIGIINSDDWFELDALSQILKVKRDTLFSIISGNKNKVNNKNKVYKTVENKKDIEKYIGRIMPLNHPATFVDKSVYEQIGFFNTNYKLSADYELIFRAYSAGVQFLFTDKVIVNMRNTGATHLTKNLFITAKEDFEIRKNNKVKFAYLYYIKRLVFNYLVIVRSKLKNLFNLF
ncbi:glycosyltransferase family 2 protein [Mariniflexile gromovii]|uniref:Glycosyltransferase n=1 Tax=Mariniflexile gromovii TaxID=362523 RepID=A0ABS4BQJ2_9FLAO|nr:glycosyltransferase family 2 protein [Mariniflexile gromovii]MBP0902858.1 glycosyltransferase [Mariniflexile gromovii]